MSTLSPREIVAELNRHIIGQEDAKRAVAVALRNRWRRRQLPAPALLPLVELREEVRQHVQLFCVWVFIRAVLSVAGWCVV